MPLSAARHRRWTLLGAGALTAGLLAGGPLAANHAHAALGCRSDPIVVLSNGVVLDLSATIDTDVSDVKEIKYKLHGPKGVWVVAAISTDGVVQYKEGFDFHDDSHVDDHNPGSAIPYTVEVKVHTQSGHHTVWVTVAGGYASQVGITPAMVGLSAFAFNPTAPQGDGKQDAPKPPHDDKNQAALPATVTAALASWASSAPWTTSVSSPPMQESDKGLATSISL